MDLLFQVMLGLGILLLVKITQYRDVYHVDYGCLIACFGKVDTER